MAKSPKLRIILIFYLILSFFLPIIWFHSDAIYTPEESSFANYQNVYECNLYSWSPKTNYGEPSAIWNHALLIPNALFYNILSYLGFSNHIIQIIFLQIFLLLLLLSISKFLNLFVMNRVAIILGALFYVFNFYIHYSALVYSAKMYQLILMPIGFLCMYNYLHTRNYKYAVYNFIALFLLQAIFTNLTQVITTMLIYIFATIYFLLIKSREFDLKFLISTAKMFFMFMILVLPLFCYHGVIGYVSIQSSDLYSSILNEKYNAPTIHAHMSDLFQFRGAWWERDSYMGVLYCHWINFYDNNLVVIVSYFIIIVIFIGSLVLTTKNTGTLFWSAIFVLSMLLASGNNILFGILYNYMPGSTIFREPWPKFMPVMLISCAVLYVFSLQKIIDLGLSRRLSRMIYVIIIVLLVIRAIPFMSPNFFDHTDEAWKRQFINPPNYWYNYECWSMQNKDKYIVVLPYNTDTLTLKYTWHETSPGNANIPMYQFFGCANVIGPSEYYSHLSKFNNVLEVFNCDNTNVNFVKLGTINYLLEQKDIDLKLIDENIIDNQYKIKHYFEGKPFLTFGDGLALYKIKSEFFLPHFYMPKMIIMSTGTSEQLPNIVSNENYNISSAIYFQEYTSELLDDQNRLNNIYIVSTADVNYGLINYTFFDYSYNITLKPLRPIETNKPSSNTVLEFRQINPIKYRVRVHNATDPFPLVFCESFHDGWTLYAVNYTEEPIDYVQLNNYKLFNDSLGYQATKEEVKGFIQKGWVTSLDDGGNKLQKLEFISKNFQGTIQNDNLPSGPFYETWFKKSLDNNENHMMVNGYANSWIINPATICSNECKCIKNPDNSYDLELVVEYWPQRLYYLCLFSIVTTLFLCLTYLLYNWRRDRRR